MQISSLFSFAREDAGENGYARAVYLHKEGFVLSFSLPFLSSLARRELSAITRKLLGYRLRVLRLF